MMIILLIIVVIACIIVVIIEAYIPKKIVIKGYTKYKLFNKNIFKYNNGELIYLKTIMNDNEEIYTLLKITYQINELGEDIYTYNITTYFTNVNYTVDNIKYYHQL